MSNYTKGRRGEALARAYLTLKLYKILESNFRAGGAEIDIIAQKGEYVVFVEVKYRANTDNGYPAQAVTPYKQGQIKKAALVYMAKHSLTNTSFRFDIIEILGGKINHIKDAFQ